MENNLKRHLDLLTSEEEYPASKNVVAGTNTSQKYGVYASAVTPLLVPELNIAPLRTPKLFVRRVFRYIDWNLTVKFPELADEEAL